MIVLDRPGLGSISRPLAVALEPRMMFDAAAATTMAEHQNEAAASPPPAPVTEPQAADPGPATAAGADGGHAVVFIDPRMNDWQTLLTDLPAGAEVHVLDTTRDGLAQIAEHLDGRSDVSAVHIIAHGEAATAILGNLRLDVSTVDAHAADLARIGNALTRDGDILFYGCDIGQGADGAALVGRIAALTGADVAASDNNTGAAAQHGDWVFETMSGPVEARLAVGPLAQHAYGDILAITHTVQGTNPFPSLTFGARIVAADFDNDGDLDILYQDGNTSGTNIFLRLNNGDGTFGAAIAKPTGVGAFTSGPLAGLDFAQITSSILAVDLNGDGRVDLVDNQGGSTVPLVYRNTGSGFTSVTSPFPTQTFTSRLVFGDFNNDGLIDALNQTNNISGNDITLYLNTGNFTFSSIVKPDGSAFTSGPFNGIDFTTLTATTVYVADLNGDGRVDIVDSQVNSVPRLLINGGGSGFSVGTPFIASQQFSGRLLFGDFNSDGYVDVLAQNGNTSGAGITLYLNNATGGYTFTPIAKPDGASFTSGPLTGIDFTQLVTTSYFIRDFDRDGDVDIVDSQNNASRYITQNGAPPRITASTPADNATGFLPSANITLTFSENVTAGAGSIRIFRSSDDALIEAIAANGARVTGSGTSSITIDPVTTLADTTSYYILFDINAFRDADGAALGIASGFSRIADTSKTSLNFTTGVNNAAPVIGNLAGDTVAFTEGGGALRIDLGADATVTDTDSPNFNNGTVSVAITTGKVAGEDLLGINTSGAVTLSAGVSVGSTVSVSGVAIGSITTGGTVGSDFIIALNANATPARVQSLLREFTYTDTNGNDPNTSARVVTVSVSDGAGGTGTVTSNITVTAVNDAPTVTAPASITVTEDVATALTGISFADVDSGASNVTVTLGVGSGTISATSGGGVTVGGTATARTLTGTVANINAFIAGSNVTFTTAQDATANVTLTVGINDGGNTGTGGAQTATANVTLNVTAVNDAPTVTAPASITVTEDVATALTGISFADVDAGGATVTVTLGVGSGTLSATSGGGVTVGGTATSRTLTGTIANINTFIAGSNVTFTTAQDATGNVTLTVGINDGGNSGSGGAQTGTANVTLAVTAVNDAPTIANLAGDTVSVVAGGAPVRIDLGQNAAVADVDSANFNGGALTITRTGGTLNGSFGVDGTTVTSGADAVVAAGEAIIVNGVTIGIVSAGSDGQIGNNLIITLNGNATPARVATLVQNLFFAAPSDFDARTFNLIVSDGAGGTSAAAGFTVNVTPSSPVISQLNGDSSTYTEGASAVGLDAGSNAIVADADSPNFNGGELRASISAGGVAAQDVLSVRAIGNVTVAAGTVSVSGIAIGTVTGGTNGADLVVALNSNATPGRVAEVVRALGYTNSDNDAPTAGTRTVQITIRDAAAGPASATSAIATVTVDVQAVNDAPTITAPASITVTEDVASALTGISFTDVDAGANPVTVTLGVGTGTLSATSGGGVTVGGTATARTLTGTVANINAFLAGSNVTFTTPLDATTNVTLTVGINDGGNSGTGGALAANANVTLAVTAVNDAPTVTAPASITVTEDMATAITGISFADVDAGGGNVTVTLGVASGTISATSGGGVTVGGTATARTLTGTTANINAFIAASNVTFTTAQDATANVTLTASINDGGNTGTSGAQTATANVTLNVTAVNDAPRLAQFSAQTAVVDVPSSVTGIVLQEVDEAGASVRATLAVPSGTLSAVSGAGVTVTGSGTGSLALVGSVNNLNTFIAAGSVRFLTAPQSLAATQLSFTVSDFGDTGAGGPQTLVGGTQLVPITVSAPNVPPTTAPTTALPSASPVPASNAAPVVVNAFSNVAFRTADPLPPVQPIGTSPTPVVPDTPQLLTGTALRQLFSGSPADTTILAQIFQGRTDLGEIPSDLLDVASQNETSSEPLLVYRDGRWYVIDLSAPGGYRSWEGLPGTPDAQPGQTFDASNLPLLAAAPAPLPFSEQVALSRDEFSRRASLLDSALAAF